MTYDTGWVVCGCESIEEMDSLYDLASSMGVKIHAGSKEEEHRRWPFKTHPIFAMLKDNTLCNVCSELTYHQNLSVGEMRARILAIGEKNGG